MREISIAALLVILPILLLSQQITFPTDVVANALGYSSSASQGASTASSNPAVLSNNTSFSFSASVRNRFLTEGLYDFGLYSSSRLGGGAIGIQLEHFSFETLRQQTVAFSYGTDLSAHFALGIKFSLQLINQAEQESTSLLNGSIGALYRWNKELVIGLELMPSKGSGNDDSNITGRVQKIGFAYSPSELVSISGDIHYYDDLDKSISSGFGLSYEILNHITLGLGYRSNPDSFSFGLSWKVNNLLFIHLSSSTHQQLGISPIGGFTYLSDTDSDSVQ